MRIALLQSRGVLGDVDANLREMATRARQAATRGAEILVCPELYVTGYNVGKELRSLAQRADGPAFEQAAKIATDNSIALLYGYPERHGESLFNAARLINARGEPVANYRKAHLYGAWETAQFQPGSLLQVVELDGLRLGILICYDVEFPESSRVLAVQGAQVILVPTALDAAWPQFPGRLIPTRALENQLFVVYANRCGTEAGKSYCGRSCVAAPDGSLLATAGDDEELVVADLELDAFAGSRALTPYMTDRRPALYGDLVGDFGVDRPEISDVIVDYDPDTLARRPVAKTAALAALRDNPVALRVLERIPAPGGCLDGDVVDEVLLRSHHELQRLSEEFQQGRRVRELLVPMLDALRAEGAPTPIRVVDIGCGLGFVVRWLAALGDLGEDVELTGCDYNRALVDAAQRLAHAEGLPCRFVVCNAFTLADAAAIYISTGVIHHFRGDALTEFFERQRSESTRAFFHFDIAPSWLAPVGAWIFHRARMREPLARHDGVLSARRAHSDAVLARAARPLRDEYAVGLYATPGRVFPVLRVLRPFVGVRRPLFDAFASRLGTRRRLFEEIE